MTRVAGVVGVVVAALAAPTVAHAETPLDRPYAFEVDREVPPPGQADFSFDGGGHVGRPGDVGPRWAVSAQVGFLDRPFRLHTVDVKIFPVEQRLTFALGGAFAFGRFVVDARMPLAYQGGDRMQGLGDDTPLDSSVAGDLGIGARLHVLDHDTYDAFVRAQLMMPTGNDFHYSGEARFTAAWMLIGRVSLPIGSDPEIGPDGSMTRGHLVVAGSAGVRFRAREVIVADRLLGDELFGSLGASYQLPAIEGLYCDANDVRVTAELHGVLGNDVGDREGASPAEARVGITSRIRSWLAIAGRVGKGIDDHIGAPRFRAMVEVVYIGNAL